MNRNNLNSSESVRVGGSAELEGKPLELSLIEGMSQIPEVESVYKYQEGEHTTFLTILSTSEYQQDVHMKVYEVEYVTGRRFPEANVGFECMYRMEMSDDEFLPAGVIRVYKRKPVS
jgi:hypothetical protein